jgi:hypothetical protein
VIAAGEYGRRPREQSSFNSFFAGDRSPRPGYRARPLDNEMEASLNSRPFYVSITAIWECAVADGFPYLRHRLSELVPQCPGHQVQIPQRSWHSTVFSLIAINRWPRNETGDVVASRMTKAVFSKCGAEIQKAFSGFTVEAHSLICFDSVTALQFRGIDSALTDFRESVRSKVNNHLNEIVQEYDGGLPSTIDSEPQSAAEVRTEIDKSKNVGVGMFGSIARAPGRNEPTAKRWSIDFSPPLPRLQFSTVFLLPSDDGLTNPGAFDRLCRYELIA